MAELARAEVVLTGNDAPLQRALSDAESRMQAAGQRMRDIGRSLSARVSLPLAAVGAASVKMASDAEESANKFDVVMGDAAERVRMQFDELHDTIPLTTAQMEGMAAGIQDMLVPMGVARNRAAGMSADMVQLAGDLASFNNVPVSQVLEAMQSGLAGMSRPLRQFGVDIRQSRLESIALSEGLIQAGEQLNNTARAQAVMIAITQDSTDAMGDAARTANSTANAMRFVGRDVKELGITIGQTLIPAVRPLIQLLTDTLSWFQDLHPSVQATAVALGAVAAAIGPLSLAIGTIISLMPTLTAGFAALTAVGGPILLGVAAIGSLVAAGNALIQNWGVIKFEVQQLVTGIRDWMVGKFGAIVTSVKEHVDKVVGFFRNLKDQVVGNSFVPDMVSGIGQEFNAMGDIMSDGLDAVLDFAMGAEDALENFVKSAIKSLAKLAFISSLNAVLPGAGALFGAGLPSGLDHGGPISPRQPHIVGESGPEVFVPSSAGNVVPNNQMGGMASNILSQLPELQRPQTPSEAARDRWWREFIRVGVQDNAERVG